MERPSQKKELVHDFWQLSGHPELHNGKLIIITAAGLITGVPAERQIDADYKDLEKRQFFTKFFDDSIRMYRKKHDMPDEESTSGNDGAIALQDVVIHSGIKQTSMPFLVVFYDQIIGVTIGNL